MTGALSRPAIGLRLLLSLIAVLAGSWLLVSWHDERLQTRGIHMLAEQPPRPREALEQFRGAQLMSASLQPQLFEASTIYLLGNHAEATADLRRLLRREPRNRTGWLLLGNWLLADDPPAANQAFRQAATLDGPADR